MSRQDKKFAERGLAFLTLGRGICQQCRWAHEDRTTCRAFPLAIPAVILTGEHDHRLPFRGDRGVQFLHRPQ